MFLNSCEFKNILNKLLMCSHFALRLRGIIRNNFKKLIFGCLLNFKMVLKFNSVFNFQNTFHSVIRLRLLTSARLRPSSKGLRKNTRESILSLKCFRGRLRNKRWVLVKFLLKIVLPGQINSF